MRALAEYSTAMRNACPLVLSVVAFGSALIMGCASPPYNRTPPENEAEVLSDVVQLTRGFDRAGEAYFSKDMRWIIFQATPKGEQQYQMHVAKVTWEAGKIVGTGEAVRVSPENSRNTCGFFSPDGASVIFASTAGKEVPDEPTSGYQRGTGNYRWGFPKGMEIFRADGWEPAVEAAMRQGHGERPMVDLAKHPITSNDAYDAECAYSPDGKWIIFSSRRSGDMELYVMRPDGGGVVQLTHENGYDGGPFFSPDGKRIVWRTDRQKENNLQVHVADLVFDKDENITGITNDRQITTDADGEVNWGPYWHPDGKHIIYASSKLGHTNYELFLMRDDGTRKTRVTFTPGPDVLPVFSPDGQWLLWACKRSADGTTQVFAARFKMPRGG